MDASVSLANVRDRRQYLQRQRRQRVLQSLWRSSAVGAMTCGLCWGLVQPFWFLSRAEVEITGNQLLTTAVLRDRLAERAPESLWRVEPRQLAADLETDTAIAAARIERRLLPPQLTVAVVERPPVAIATAPEAGFLDATGVWMPADSYRDPDQVRAGLNLEVVGYGPHVRTDWTELYAQLQTAPVPIARLDWSNPSELTATTDLGPVRFGTYRRERFAAQLTALARLRHLPETVPPARIAYIDLRDPESPILAER